ncbi:tyrosine-protein phosphatase non-receptor type 4-like isoform X13 [Haliotis rufescens]|uniref:tyrosine-protein phosphatase non-receptor type 4-like isoform X13 n=1 Tax=Haliotis rufescens TaxID=6454 RepID=UPI001EB0776E|nr:tyrosine-protein phosphatase non-receptor type 4-like isoform X13 [Haliotis rufescens]
MVVTEMVVFMASPFERGSQAIRKEQVFQLVRSRSVRHSVQTGNGEIVKTQNGVELVSAGKRPDTKQENSLVQEKMSPSRTANGLVQTGLYSRSRHKSCEHLPSSLSVHGDSKVLQSSSSIDSELDKTDSSEQSDKKVLPIILKKKIKVIRGKRGFRIVSGDKGRSSISAQRRSLSSANEEVLTQSAASRSVSTVSQSDLTDRHDNFVAQRSSDHPHVPKTSPEVDKGKRTKSVSWSDQEKRPQIQGKQLAEHLPQSGVLQKKFKVKKSVKFQLDKVESDQLKTIGDKECVGQGDSELMQVPRETGFQLIGVQRDTTVDKLKRDVENRLHVDAKTHSEVEKVVNNVTVKRATSQRLLRSGASFSGATKQSLTKEKVFSGLVRMNSIKSHESAKQQDSKLVVRRCVIGGALTFRVVQLPPAYEGSNGNGYADGHGLVTIRMTPDDLGRFGFNVKGGADQGMPIIVSRVAPGTPADLAIPRLNEGDQVLFINGRDVSQHTHEQVVMFIKASRETHSGELVLVVRPNVYVGEDQSEEPDFTYIPETHQIASSSSSANTLESSLMLLQESLESGAALAQFEQLYRKKPNMTMNAARNESNIPKNRYRDISPYDKTRVVLKTGSSGDYINANYVNMEIPGSGIVNRYIAAQGPLPNTCTDFWQMVWEQHSSLVVMLTTKVERGRVKCHQYWPELYETEDFGALQITCVKEEETPSFAFREFNLTHVETSEERHIRHMQYIAWPDHGVPDDPSDFLEFVMKVRQNRSGMVEPTIVHCSAGIGRTGVLITMETAMCRVEARQPVYPLIVVKEMRDQRAMLIQTSSQYKFVCEAILRVYNEGLVKPSEDYHR